MAMRARDCISSLAVETHGACFMHESDKLLRTRRGTGLPLTGESRMPPRGSTWAQSTTKIR